METNLYGEGDEKSFSQKVLMTNDWLKPKMYDTCSKTF